MSWKLANEPRPGGSDAGVARNRDATLLTDERRADPLARNHLVSLGHEGT
jgi:mannan endo-1,4-beta-mannosidase